MASNPLSVNEEELGKLSPARQRELRDLLIEYSGGLEQNPLAAYIPHSHQVEFHASHDTLKAFIGGNRSGKTTAGIVDDLIQAIDPAAVPPHLAQFKKWEPPFHCRIVAPDLTQTLEEIYHKIREWCPREQMKGGGWDTAFSKQNRVFTFENGSKFGFFTYEMDVDKFGGTALHRVHFDEEPSGPNGKMIRQECQMRLIDYDGDELFTMTPLFGLSFTYDEVWQRRMEPGITAIQVDMDDNPHLSEKAKKRLLAPMSREERQARKEGRYVHFGGVFYDEFSDSLHVRKAPHPEVVKDWDTVVGIDPGSRTGIVWIGFDSDNSAFVFDELYPLGLVVPDIAEQIRLTNQKWGIDPSYVIDPAARIRTGPNQEQFTTEYARHGIYCASGQNARGPGIMEVKRRLQKAALFFSKDCKHLIWEIGRYRRDPGAQDEWTAIKTDDHLCDALRYGVMARTWTLPSAPRRRDNWNSDPMFEPPWRGMPQTDNPPLGVMS